MNLDVKKHRESLLEAPREPDLQNGKRGVSRRGFLGGTGALVVGIAVPKLARPATAGAAPPAPLRPPPPEGPNQLQVDSWLAVHGDGTVTVFTGRSELGTGTTTSSLQIIADELDVAFDRLKIVDPDTHLTADQVYTAGSQTTKTQWAMGMRGAAIQARAQLLAMGSQRLGVPVGQLSVADGVISGGGRTVTYAELIGDRHFNARIDPRAQGKSPSQLKVVGQSVRRIDIPAKVMGTYPYVQDVVLEGMLHARMKRPPTIDSELLDVNDADVLRMPGIVKVAVKGNRIGVIAHTEQQAIDGMQALKPRWRIAPLPPMERLYDDLRSANPHSRRVLVQTLVDSRGAPEAIREAAKQHSASYFWPYQLHGTLGASCAVADIGPRSGTVYSPTQGVYPLRDAIAMAVGLDRDAVHVIYVEGSGCYGLNSADSVSLDAALMSAAVGAPVRVQYMRDDEHTTENFGQPMVMEASAGLDDHGNLVGWNYSAYIGNRGARPGPPGNLTAGGIAGFPAAPQMPSPPPEPPLGPDSSNATAQYLVPHMRVVSLTVPSRFFTGMLRSPTRIQNTFANESFIDELSVLAGEDPIDFRLKHLNDPRLLAVIREVRKRANWKTGVAHSSPGGNDRVRGGVGMAAVQYEGTEAYVAVVVHVTVDMHSGQVKVKHVWAAQDCGIAINPDGMRAQAEGCVIQGISRALIEEVRWTATSMESIDWITYPVLTFTQMPESFDFQIIDRPDIPPVGAGEVVITATPAAIANAIFDATGARLRQVPMTPERVRAALQAA